MVAHEEAAARIKKCNITTSHTSIEEPSTMRFADLDAPCVASPKHHLRLPVTPNKPYDSCVHQRINCQAVPLEAFRTGDVISRCWR